MIEPVTKSKEYCAAEDDCGLTELAFRAGYTKAYGEHEGDCDVDQAWKWYRNERWKD